MKVRILIAIVVALLLAFLAYTLMLENDDDSTKKKVFDDKIVYSEKTYRPYDTKFAYNSFKKHAKKGFDINKESPSISNELIYSEDSNTKSLLAIVSPYFLPTPTESVELINYVSAGNNVFISSINMSPAFIDSLLKPKEPSAFYNNYPPIPYIDDSISIFWPKINKNYLAEKDTTFIIETLKYSYPGEDIPNYYEKYFLESDYVTEIAYDKNSSSTLVSVEYGAGHFYIQMRPMTMTNYFLLHKKNYQYLNEIFELIDLKNRKVIWDSFYKYQVNQRTEYEANNVPSESYLLNMIMERKPLLWSVCTFFLAIGLFIVLHSRRMQAPIKILPDITNNSLEFSQAVSGLYWLNQDHQKIAEKIILQLQDYFHVHYRILPRELLKENSKKIIQKTNKKESDVNLMFDYISLIQTSREISKKTLLEFYKNAFAIMK
jgi:hypothetical protein